MGFCIAALAKLKVIAAKVMKNGKPLDQDPLFAARMAQVEIDLENMKTTNLRVIAAVAGGGVPGAESSMLKIRGTEIRQEILSLMRRAVGRTRCPSSKKPSTKAMPTNPWARKRLRRLPPTTSTTANCRSLAAPMKSEEHHFKNDLGPVRLPR